MLALLTFLTLMPVDTDENRIWLARMLVYEGGWTNHTEHLALAHTVTRRWRQVWSPKPLHTFVQAYSTGLSPRWRPNKRRRWVRGLQWSSARPEAFSRRLDWDRHARWWKRIRKTTVDFLQGRTKDPCRGKAGHWAAPWIKRPGWVRVKCGDTRNVFYR